jgi:hypothetical protein
MSQPSNEQNMFPVGSFGFYFKPVFGQVGPIIQTPKHVSIPTDNGTFGANSSNYGFTFSNISNQFASNKPFGVDTHTNFQVQIEKMKNDRLTDQDDKFHLQQDNMRLQMENRLLSRNNRVVMCGEGGGRCKDGAKCRRTYCLNSFGLCKDHK